MDALVVKAEEGRDTTAIVAGKASKAYDPAVSEWGNPALCKQSDSDVTSEGEPGELKHLSTRRKRYSLSSGERKGKSPNSDVTSEGCGTPIREC